MLNEYVMIYIERGDSKHKTASEYTSEYKENYTWQDRFYYFYMNLGDCVKTAMGHDLDYFRNLYDEQIAENVASRQKDK